MIRHHPGLPRPLCGLLPLLPGMFVISSACGAGEPSADEEEARLTELSMVRIEGQVEIGSAAATDVRVTGRCGRFDFETETDQDGRYTLDVDVSECDRITIEHDKERYLPEYRIITVPPPASPLALGIELEEMDELECGIEICHTETGTHLETGGEIARGYQLSMAGSGALAHAPAELRDQDDELISLLGFHYLELRDKDGDLLPSIPEIPGCSPIDDEGLSWAGDIDPSTPEVELEWYRYDPITGRWKHSDRPAVLHYERGNAFEVNTEGKCVTLKDEFDENIKELLPVERDALPDVRSGDHRVPDPCDDGDPPKQKNIRKYWVCGPVDGGGFYGYGLSVPDTSCYTVDVRDACDERVADALLTIEGVDHGFRAQAFTGPDSNACLDVLSSEPVGEDFDFDGLGGETFWVDLRVEGAGGGRVAFEMHENLREPGSCAEPDSCVRLEAMLRGCKD